MTELRQPKLSAALRGLHEVLGSHIDLLDAALTVDLNDVPADEWPNGIRFVSRIHLSERVASGAEAIIAIAKGIEHALRSGAIK